MMHLFFKHMAIRCWITVLTAVPIALLVIPRFSFSTSFLSAPGMYGVIIGVVFTAAGITMNQLGRRLIKNAITRAGISEQANAMEKSKTAFIDGIGIYNSGLITPWRSGKTVEKLTGAMARFSLTHDIKNPIFEDAAVEFLKRTPGDMEVARQWLEKAPLISSHNASSARVLTLLARKHKDNVQLLPLLARRLMKSRRNDFDARIIYCNCLEKKLIPPQMEKEIREATHGSVNRTSAV